LPAATSHSKLLAHALAPHLIGDACRALSVAEKVVGAVAHREHDGGAGG
jgi:hypothetical protein